MTREEAIRIIEANCSCSESTLMEACAMFIPELRESYDERVRKNIVATIEQCPDDFLSPKNRNRMLAYLEKLKEQKPTWSEEDDATIKSAVHWLEKYLSTIKAKDVSSATQEGILTVKTTITNLKSLCPCPSWKPSEEQIKALESCFCEFGEGCPDEDGLRSLYNDIKKL